MNTKLTKRQAFWLFVWGMFVVFVGGLVLMFIVLPLVVMFIGLPLVVSLVVGWLRKGGLGLGYEINPTIPKHPTRRVDIYIRRKTAPSLPPIKLASEYCGICKQNPCKYW